MLWDVDVYYSESSGDGPVDIGDEIVSLGESVRLGWESMEGTHDPGIVGEDLVVVGIWLSQDFGSIYVSICWSEG